LARIGAAEQRRLRNRRPTRCLKFQRPAAPQPTALRTNIRSRPWAGLLKNHSKHIPWWYWRRKASSATSAA
jgi:hypothetical protein